MTNELDRLTSERDALVRRLDAGWATLDAKKPGRSVDDPESVERWFGAWLGLLRSYEGLCDRISSISRG